MTRRLKRSGHCQTGRVFAVIGLLLLPLLGIAQDRNLQVGRAGAPGEQRIALVIGNSSYKTRPLRTR